MKDKLATGTNPMRIKMSIARNIITQYHDEASARQAQDFFVSQFQNKAFDEKAFTPFPIKDLPDSPASQPALALCHLLMKDETKSTIRRLIVEGAVQINTMKVTDPYQLIPIVAHTKVKIGKRTFIELV